MSGAVAFVVREVEKRYGATAVLENATVTIHCGTKVGFIGRNGAGKSTLCRLLLGQEEPERGSIKVTDGLRVGYLEQHDLFTLEETADEFLQRHTGQEGWRVGEVSAKLGLRPDDLASTMGSLPGGYRTRVKLAAMLLQDPDFLVLDEPTNFLDLSTVLLLQDFLASFRGGAIVVSHDREFLKATCDHTLLVERGGLTLYPGPVEEFFAWQAEQLEVARKTNATMQARRQELQDFVNRFRAKASKASQAQSKLKQIGRLQPITVANPLATVRIHIPPVEERNGMAIAGEDLTIGYGDTVIAADISFGVDRGQKVAIVGDNGQGKTTLLRTLAGDLPKLGGRVRHGHGTEISYYAQHVYQSLHPDDTVFTHLESSADPDVSRQAILAMAGSLLFRGDDVDKPVGVLSGGERARVCLGGLLLARRSILVLDEPTNHLDFETVEALGAALRDFAGTVLFVSHDRTFVNMAATRIVEVHDGRVRTLAGSYADYVEDLQKRARRSAAPTRSKQANNGQDAKAAHAARRKLRNEGKKAQRELAKLEKRMEQLQAERAEIAARIATAGDDAAALYIRLTEIDAESSTAETQWLEFTDAIERAAQA